MGRYIIKRVFQGLISCLLLITMVFFLMRVSGDPAVWMISPKAGATVRAQIMEKYGFDKPLVTQYFLYIGNLLKGDFGTSYYYNKPTVDVILQRLPATLQLTSTALLIAVLIGIPIGVYSAYRKGQAIDVLSRGVAFFAISIPPFWLGLMLILLFSVKLHWLPAGGSSSGAIILPAITLALTLAGSILRLTRSGMLDVLNNDYIKFAKAKGVPKNRLIWRHAFKNASIPVITMIMLLMVVILSGDVVIENIFSWNGVGKLVMVSVFNRDYPIVMAFTIFVGLTFTVISIIADILYAVVNPKIRY